MATMTTGNWTGDRWTNYEVAAAAQRSGRAAKSLARWHGSDDLRRAVLAIMSAVFSAATSVRSAHEWAERVVELHYPDAGGRRRHFAVQALRVHTLQGVPVGWNTALSVLLIGDGRVSNLAESAGAQSWADEIFLAVVGDDPDGAAGGRKSPVPGTSRGGGAGLSHYGDGPPGKDSRSHAR
jgi:hypothetical protein